MADVAIAVSIAKLEGEIERARQHSEGGERQIRERWAFTDRRFELIETAADKDRAETVLFRTEMRLAQAKTDGEFATLTATVGSATEALGALNATIAGKVSWAEVVKTNPMASVAVVIALLVAALFMGGYIEDFNADALGNKFGINNSDSVKPAPTPALSHPRINEDIESDGTDYEPDFPGPPVPLR